MLPTFVARFFVSKEKWVSVCELIGVVGGDDLQRLKPTQPKLFAVGPACCAVPPSDVMYQRPQAEQIKHVQHSRARASLISMYTIFEPGRVLRAYVLLEHEVGEALAAAIFGIWTNNCHNLATQRRRRHFQRRNVASARGNI